MKTVIEMARDQGLPETEVAGVFIVNQDDLSRFAALVRADERNATLDEIAKWLKDEKDAPYWAELVRARRSNT
jgi:hypothetical protein